MESEEENLTLGLLQVAWEAGGLASSSQDGAEGRGQAAHSDPAERDEGGREAAVRHAAAEAQVLRGQQRLQDADEAERRAALGNEVHLVPVWTQVRGDLLQRPGPGQTQRTLSFYSKSDHLKAANSRFPESPGLSFDKRSATMRRHPRL